MPSKPRAMKRKHATNGSDSEETQGPSDSNTKRVRWEGSVDEVDDSEESSQSVSEEIPDKVRVMCLARLKCLKLACQICMAVTCQL
jgi:hypothetical protein